MALLIAIGNALFGSASSADFNPELPSGNYIVDGAGEYITDGAGEYIVDGT